MNEELIKTLTMGEQDGRGVGGRGVHLSPRIHQEYTFRHRSACRTPAESGLKTPGRTKDLGEKPGVLLGLDMPLAGGGTEAGV